MADESDSTGVTRRVATPPPHDFIAENLRALFRNADSEPLPETLQALLDRLAREEER